MVRKHEGKRPLEKPWHKWEADINMDLTETRYAGVDWIQLAKDRFLLTVMAICFHKSRELINQLNSYKLSKGDHIYC